MSAAHKSLHEKRITDIEVVTEQTWFRRVQTGDLQGAAAIQNKGYSFEHFEALLADNPEDRTSEELDLLTQRQRAFENELGKTMNEALRELGRDDFDLR